MTMTRALKNYILGSYFYSIAEAVIHADIIRRLGAMIGIKYMVNINKRIKNLKLLLSPGNPKLVFDVGANIGTMSATYSCAGWNVIAIEPDPINFRRLKFRFKLNKLVKILPLGVASRQGWQQLSRYSDCTGHNTFSSKRIEELASSTNPVLGNPVLPDKDFRIQMTTLDQLIDIYGSPDYIKIDVEGFELEVIRGLSQPIKLLTFECNLPSFLNESIECIQILDSISSMYRYNFLMPDHCFSVLSGKWLSGKDMIEHLRCSDSRFAEIVAKLATSP